MELLQKSASLILYSWISCSKSVLKIPPCSKCIFLWHVILFLESSPSSSQWRHCRCCGGDFGVRSPEVAVVGSPEWSWELDCPPLKIWRSLMDQMGTIVRIANCGIKVVLVCFTFQNASVNELEHWCNNPIGSYNLHYKLFLSCNSAFLYLTCFQAKVVPVYHDDGAAQNRYIYSNGDIFRLPSGLTSTSLWATQEPFKRWVLASWYSFSYQKWKTSIRRRIL